MRNNPEGGLVVFITSDSDFLKDVNAVVENHKFRAELLFYGGKQMSKAPGMREKAHMCYEWMGWLREQMQMPQLQMHDFDKEKEWRSPSGSSGISFFLTWSIASLVPDQQHPWAAPLFVATIYLSPWLVHA